MVAYEGTGMELAAREDRWRVRYWFAGAAAYVIAYGIWLVVGLGGPSLADVISDAAFLPVSLVAGLLSWRAARRQTSWRHRRAWKLIAVSYFCYWAGDVGWFYFDAVRGTRPYPSLADAGYLSFYPFIAGGLIYLGSKARSWREWAILGLDTLTVTVGGLLVIWYLVIDPTIAADAAAKTEWLARTLDVAYPLGDVIVLFAMAVVLVGGPSAKRNGSLALLTGGLCLFVGADVIYSRMSLLGGYSDTSWVNELWMVGQAMTALSAYLAGRPRHLQTGAAGAPTAERRVSRLPYLAVGVALVLLLIVGAEKASRSLMELLAGVVLLTAIVAVRQLAALQDNRRLMSALRTVAETDHLTGIASRAHFFEVAEATLGQLTADQTVGILMIDIDHFKSINDSFGHLVGDQVLRQAAACVNRSVRDGDLVGRLGGDELAVLLPTCSPDTLVQVATRLTSVIRGTFAGAGDAKVVFTASIGGTCLHEGYSLSEGISRADVALYRTKRSGRDNWTIDSTTGPPREAPPVAVMAQAAEQY